MRSFVTRISAVVLSLALAAALYLYYGTRGALVTAAQFPVAAELQTESAAQPRSGAPFPVGRRQVVELAADKATLGELTRRERRDQYLDWLLLTAISAFTPSLDEINRATFDLPAVRHGYMRPLANFEYGETRSRFIGDGTVLTLIPFKISDAARKDHLAHVADEHRKNLGGRFERLIVLEYELDAELASAALTRRADIAWSELFSPAYGYFEQQVAKLEDLAAFMARVDDLTSADKNAEGLLLGGRKILSRSYRAVKVEQVATIWQAEKKIQVALDAFESKTKRKVDDFNNRWSARTYRGAVERAMLERERDTEWTRLEEQVTEERINLKLVNGSGFSLDPTYDYAALQKGLVEIQAPLSAVIGAAEVDKMRDALSKRDIVPLLRVQNQLSDLLARKPTQDLNNIFLQLRLLERINRFQAARYDGDLQGTEAGMVLFYTDLLAKLWVINFIGSSPNNAIEGFVDGLSVASSAIYDQENKELPSGRLWFGKSDLGFQVGADRNSLLFARNATRVYSAGSNPLSPGFESETSVALGTPISWWNDHYEEIGRYEQEYERLNQIMKWSIAIGWLNNEGDGNKLDFLADARVDRANVFPAWVKKHRELRFANWDKIVFFPPGNRGNSTESLPLLTGIKGVMNGSDYWLEGGVSLAPKAAFKGRISIPTSLEPSFLRSNINYGSSQVGAKTFTTFENTVYSFKAVRPDSVSLLARAKPEAKLRATTAELVNSDVERAIVRGAGDELRMETRAAGLPLGDLRIAPVENGFRVGWRARDLDAAHATARRMSTAAEPAEVLARDPGVTAVVRMPGEADFLVRLRGSDNWLRFTKEQAPSRDMAKGWQMRVADFSGAKRNIQVAAVERAEIPGMIGSNRHLAIEASARNDAKVWFAVSEQARPQNAKLIDVDIGGTRVKVWVEDTGSIHLVGGPGELGADLVTLGRRFQPADLDKIRTAARTNATSVELSVESVVGARVTSAAESGNLRQAALDASQNPAAARRALDQRLASEIAANAEISAAKGAEQAAYHLDELIKVYGPLPELTLRRAIHHIEANRAADAAAAVGRPSRPLRGREAFFSEINQRLTSQSLPARARTNLRSYAEYADFQDIVLRRSRDLGDVVRPLADGGNFGWALHLGKTPDLSKPAIVDAAKLRSGRAVVYRQDSPGLNNLDWTISPERTLQQITEGRLGKVVRLPRGDVAHFRPSAIYLPEQLVLRKVYPRVEAPALGQGYRACNSASDLCSDNSSDAQGTDVYLVTAN
jgi:hypothetical protein